MARIKEVHSPDMVAHIWAHQSQEHARTSTSHFTCQGRELRSYSTTIGFHFGEFVLLSRDSMTATTSGQLSSARGASSHLRRIDSGIFRYGSRCYDYRPPTPDAIITELGDHLRTLLTEMPKKRTVSTKSYHAAAIHQAVDDINYLRKFFKIRKGKDVVVPADLTELVAHSKAKVIELDKAREKAKKLADAAEKKKNADLIKQWLAGEGGYLPYGCRTAPCGTGQMITVRHDEAVTSEGATAPIEHVRKALDFYFRKSWPWQKNGHRVPLGHFEIDSIDEEGNVKAGCHFFVAAEILRFTQQWFPELLGEEVKLAA